jgi:uncharacterized protein (DUF1015 family)
LASIRPFRGTRFNPGSFNDLAPVIAPPYDVISDAMRDVLIGQSQHNIVQIDFGAEQSGDGASSNRYTRAAALFREWRADEVLVDDPSPTLTIYAQDYALPDGRAITRAGIFAAVELMALGPKGVMPHERTFDGPKADRLNLTRATNANFSAIFALYADPEERVNALIAEQMKSSPPTMKGRTGDGILHRAWVVDDPAFIEGVRSALADKALYIADGHHRYETALNYAAEQGCKGGSDHTLIYLVSTEDPGLEILPTHRVLHADLKTDTAAFLAKAREHFDVSEIPGNWQSDADAAASTRERLAEAGKAGPSFAVLLPDGAAQLLTLRAGTSLDSVITEEMPTAKKALDVSILHFHLIDKCWLAGRQMDLDESRCHYVRDIGEAMNLVKSGEGAVAFLMNATTMDQLKEISALGERMPQKSTYFYPKIATGVVIRDMGLGSV